MTVLLTRWIVRGFVAGSTAGAGKPATVDQLGHDLMLTSQALSSLAKSAVSCASNSASICDCTLNMPLDPQQQLVDVWQHC